MNSSVFNMSVWLDWVEHGNRLGIPVLFLHGYTDSRRSFDRLIGVLPESVHAITVSLRGHGDSPRPEQGYTPDDLASDVVALMDRMGFKRAVIVGHSMGATVAQRFALSYPQRTVGLVLIGSFFGLRGSPKAQEFWESTVSRLEDPIDPEIVRDFQLSTIARSLPETFIDLIVRESLKVPASVWKGTFKRSDRNRLHTRTRQNPRSRAAVMGRSGCFRDPKRSRTIASRDSISRFECVPWCGTLTALGASGTVRARNLEFRVRGRQGVRKGITVWLRDSWEDF